MIGTGLWRNPILSREIDHRMRDNRTYFVPVVYISVLGLVTLGIYLAMGGMAAAGQFHSGMGDRPDHLQCGDVYPDGAHPDVGPVRERGGDNRRAGQGNPRASAGHAHEKKANHYRQAGSSSAVRAVALEHFASICRIELRFRRHGPENAGHRLRLMKRTVPAVLLAYGLVAAIVIGSVIAEVVVHITFNDLDTIVFLYLNPFTPLIFADGGAMANEVSAHWWITPAVQVVLGALFLSIAHLRIRNMRS